MILSHSLIHCQAGNTEVATSAIPGCSSSVVVKSKADMAGWLKLEYMAPRDLLTSTGVGHAPYNGSLYRECH